MDPVQEAVYAIREFDNAMNALYALLAQWRAEDAQREERRAA